MSIRTRITLIQALILLSVFVICAPAFQARAQTSPETKPKNMEGSQNSNAKTQSESGALRRERIRLALIQKFTLQSGDPASIVLYEPDDETRARLGEHAADSMVEHLKSMGAQKVSRSSLKLTQVTLESFRDRMVAEKADILIHLIARPSHFELYMYDKRSPYFIYAHTETIPEDLQSQLNPALAGYYARLVLRRTLFRYLTDKYYELPREEVAPVLQAEIPKWVGSGETLELVNREINSHVYLGVSLGAAVNMGKSKQLWNSNVIGLQVGLRPYGQWYLEGSYETFSYNAFSGFIKYAISSRDTPLRIVPGIGLAKVTRAKVWIPDATLGLPAQATYFVPTLSAVFPIGDVLLKAELRSYSDFSFSRHVWMFLPGVQIPLPF